MKLKCPTNPKISLLPKQLTEGLTAYTATDGSGHWLSRGDYMAWVLSRGEKAREDSSPCEANLDLNDVEHAKICPECGRILIKYKVGRGLSFYVEHCPGCGGVWLDRNEWEALEQKQLHDDIHMIFSSQWQKGVREESLRKRFTEVYTSRFGAEGYEQVKEFRAWLTQQGHPQEIIAYLVADDPYKL